MTSLKEPSVDFHLKLNQQQFNIPVELLKRNWDQCNILFNEYSEELEQHFSILEESLKDSANDTASIEQLNKIISYVDSLQKKLSQLNNRELEILRRIEKRIEHFNNLYEYKNNHNTDKLMKWYKSYTDLLIADYLIRHGSSKQRDGTPIKIPAVEYLEKQGLQDLIDYDVLLEANTITIELLENRNLHPLLDWIAQNRQYLNDKGSSLEFQALLQQYVELVRLSDFKGAVGCFQKCLKSFINKFPLELKLAAGILVFFKSCQNQYHDETLSEQQRLYQLYFRKPIYKSHSLTQLSTNNVVKNAELSRYGQLLSPDRWEAINQMFAREFYSLYNIPYHDPLLIYLSLGISALKTKDCAHKTVTIPHENEKVDKFINSRVLNTECPVCNEDILPLSQDLPFAHHTQSSLFENPVMLPNGNIYDSEKLLILATKMRKMGLLNLEENQVMDPIDKSIYSITDFITMYPT